MRVLHISGDTGVGGIETILKCLAKNRAVCPDMQQEFAFPVESPAGQQIELMGMKAHRFGPVSFKHPLWVLKARRRMRRILRDGAFDVTIFHQYAHLPLMFGGIAKKYKTKMVRCFHNEISPNYWVERALGRVFPWFPHMAIFPSKFLRDKVAAPRSRVIPYPADARTTISDAERLKIRISHGAGDDTVVIMHASRMVPIKGHIDLLEALATLSQNNWICWLVGGPQSPAEEAYFDRVKSAAERLGIIDRVIFFGTRNDVPRLLAGADIFCHPNIPPGEGFGIVFLEALQSGVPVITTAVGAAPEIVTDDCGKVVPPNDRAELARAISSLLSGHELRRRCAAHARTRGAYYLPEKVLPRFEQAFAELMAATSSPA